MSDIREWPLGAERRPSGECSFLVWAPHAARASVTLTGDEREPARVVELDARDERGYHGALVANVAAGQRYALLLDDDDSPLPDPASRLQPDGVHGASQVLDHRAVSWTDDAWRGVALDELIIYELHVGTFTPEGTFDAIIPRLDELAYLGITAIELMPIAEFPGARNWGYDGVDLFAAHHAYGGPDGLRRLVDAAHARDIAVLLDVVYNHFGPEGNYLARFGPYLTDAHHTPWGDAVNVDGAGSDEVRRFFIENALYWLAECHIDGLRLDAVHGIVDTSARRFLAQLADAVADLAERTGVPRIIIAESDLNDPHTLTPTALGGDGCHAQWTDDLHHALHVVLTGERHGYYADYDGIDDLVTALRCAFVYTGRYSPSRQRSHGAFPRYAGSDERIGGAAFVVYAQNHDQVGNRPAGDRLTVRLTPAQLRLAAAFVALAPFTPMLFMGEEYGDTSPFPYFVSHSDPQLVAAVRHGRAHEFAHFRELGAPPDPQATDTFHSARLDWQLRDVDGHAQLLELHRALFDLRRTSPALRELTAASVDVRHTPGSAQIIMRRQSPVDAGDDMLVSYNFGDQPCDIASDETWHLVLDTDDPRFGGDGAATARSTQAPFSARVYRIGRQRSTTDETPNGAATT